MAEIFGAAVRAVHGRECVARYLQKRAAGHPWHVVAVGKAAAAMMQGATDTLGGSVAATLVITKTGHCTRLPGPTCLEAGHPVPDGRSLAAGSALKAFLRAAPSDAHFLFLISGGTSALVESLPDGVVLSDLQRVNRWLLGSGLDIHAVNRVRGSLSLIKGGRLAFFLEGRPALNLLMSDVPADDPAVIGGGLLVPPFDTLRAEEMVLPDWVLALLAAGAPPGDQPAVNVETHIVARSIDARRAAAEAGRRLGYRVRVHDAVLTEDAAATGMRLSQDLRGGSVGLDVWSAETTVRLPLEPGRGGRCQHLALSAALGLRECREVVLLAGGTDGTDGPTRDAGALVDGDTVARGEGAGLSAARCLEAADAGTFLAASGDLLTTGPTGANVMDLILGLRTD